MANVSLILVMVTVGTVGTSYASCPSPDQAAAARAAVAANCSCTEAASHPPYVRCAKAAARAAVAVSSCATPAIRCASHSICGRPGVALCCRTSPGGVRPRLVHDAGQCVASPAHPACVSDAISTCDACDAAGCATTTTTVVATTTTTTNPPGHCGNGIIQPGPSSQGGEQCDGQPLCGNDCLLHVAASCDLGGGYCIDGGTPAIGFEVYWTVGKPCYLSGGQGRAGACTPMVPATCLPPPDGVTLPPSVLCGTIVDRPLPATTLCCQSAATCRQATVASDAELLGFPCDLEPFGSDILMVGACGDDGLCVPAP